jgi:hypothetical protein
LAAHQLYRKISIKALHEWFGCSIACEALFVATICTLLAVAAQSIYHHALHILSLILPVIRCDASSISLHAALDYECIDAFYSPLAAVADFIALLGVLAQERLVLGRFPGPLKPFLEKLNLDNRGLGTSESRDIASPGLASPFPDRYLCFVSEEATAFMKPQGDYYDPDEDVRHPSPGLVPTQINYTPEETPPPYIPTSSSSSASLSPDPDESNEHRQGLDDSAHPSAKKKRKRRKKRRTRPSQGDAVLISYLDPNRPDIAREVAQRALNSASQSEAGDEVEEEEEEDMSGGGGGDDDDEDGRTKDVDGNSSHAIALEKTASAALNDVAMKDSAPERPVLSASLAMHGAVNGVEGHGLGMEDSTQDTDLTGLEDSKVPAKSLPPPLPLAISATSLSPKTEVEDDSIITSPALAPFAITAAEANPDNTLPAMQKSPPRSTCAHSPNANQSLPSLQTTLSQIGEKPMVETPNGLSPFPQNAGPSPTMNRSHFLAGNPGPSPSIYSNPSPASSKEMTSMSPPGYPNHPNFWRHNPKDGSFSTTSTASVPGLTPVSAYTTPTPKDIASPESSNGPQLLNGPLPANGPFTSTAFKCTYAGCTAAPFQTQYLLTSHANVHSSSRPHYCPVKSCPRSIGGKGFKRKNEMIRHGLVHASPGYMCPFCAEQQHKYPRPDNLQR